MEKAMAIYQDKFLNKYIALELRKLWYYGTMEKSIGLYRLLWHFDL